MIYIASNELTQEEIDKLIGVHDELCPNCKAIRRCKKCGGLIDKIPQRTYPQSVDNKHYCEDTRMPFAQYVDKQLEDYEKDNKI